jgi:hypothetical protein
MRLAGLMLVALTVAVAAVAPALAQDKIVREPETAPPPSVKERALLHEEDRNDPQGRHIAGSVAWASEIITPNFGRKELVITGRIKIPERQMSMVLTLRHNIDRSLPATHTIDLYFILPEDASSGPVLNVPGIWMKQAENAPGAPLAGLAVKTTNGFFLIGLSEAPAEREHNVAMLKERTWFEIPMTLSGGLRAIMALEKGASGETASAQAFAEWEK